MGAIKAEQGPFEVEILGLNDSSYNYLKKVQLKNKVMFSQVFSVEIHQLMLRALTEENWWPCDRL